MTLKVKIPTDMTEKQKDLLRQFYGETTASRGPVEPEPAKEEKKSFTEKMKDGFKDLFD